MIDNTESSRGIKLKSYGFPNRERTFLSVASRRLAQPKIDRRFVYEGQRHFGHNRRKRHRCLSRHCPNKSQIAGQTSFIHYTTVGNYQVIVIVDIASASGLLIFQNSMAFDDNPASQGSGLGKDAFGICNGDDRVFHFGDGFLNQSLRSSTVIDPTSIFL